jgi:hypothetical protein
VLRLLAVVAALCTLLALTGWMESWHHDDDHLDCADHATTCTCLCHAGIALLPEIIPAPTLAIERRMDFRVDIERKAQDVVIAIDPPPDKAA